MKNFYIIPIEPLENRYTMHWHLFLKDQFRSNLKHYDNVFQIEGEQLTNKTTDGAFLNFSSTIYYKNTQSNKIAELFQNNLINDGDAFLFTDAWNPTVHNLKYMAELFNKDIKIFGIWHAGNYDVNDILGQKIKNKFWVESLEQSYSHVYDLNFFATNYHKNLFSSKYIDYHSSYKRCGFPMEYYRDKVNIRFIPIDKKEKIIVFPHRISAEKRPDIFEKLSKKLKKFKFIHAQETCKNKEEYHRLLERSMFSFSASEQETLGISMYESLLAGCIPIMPDRLSYSEMYNSGFTYHPSDLNDKNLTQIVEMIKYLYENRDKYVDIQKQNIEYLNNVYFSGDSMYEVINAI